MPYRLTAVGERIWSGFKLEMQGISLYLTNGAKSVFIATNPLEIESLIRLGLIEEK